MEGVFLTLKTFTEIMVINKFSIVVSSILAVPQFRRDSEPVNFNGTNDDEVIIRCDADAIPSSSTQWYMNGDPLNGKNLGKWCKGS